MSRDTGYLPEIVLASGAWEFMSLNIPTVAAVDWTENSSGLVFDVFNHEFPSEVQRRIVGVSCTLHMLSSMQMLWASL